VAVKIVQPRATVQVDVTLAPPRPAANAEPGEGSLEEDGSIKEQRSCGGEEAASVHRLCMRAATADAAALQSPLLLVETRLRRQRSPTAASLFVAGVF
jgi:hypothetical protein